MTSTPPVPATPSATGGWLRWAPVLVVLVAWSAHAAARNATWVLEDARLVRDNAAVLEGPAAIPRLLAGRSQPEASAAYGPLAMASFALEAPLWRGADGTLGPRGFHLTNLLLHGLCSILLLRLLLGLVPRRPLVGLGAALVFAAHPLHAGVVTALVGRGPLLAVFFGLLTVLAWRAWDGRHHAWLPLAALAWLLALQGSEAALGLPLVILLLEGARAPEGGRRWARAPWLLVFALPLALWAATWPGLALPGSDLPPQSLGLRLGIGFEGLARSVLALVLPVGLHGDHTDEALPGVGYGTDAATWVLAAVCVLLGVATLVRALRGRAGLFSGAWLATLALALPLFVLQPAGRALETSFAYAAGLPLFVAAGGLAQGLLGLRGRAPAGTFERARAALAGAIALLALVALTHKEAAAWRDDEAFHQRLLERNPRHVRAMVRLARTQRRTAAELRAAAAALPADTPERGAYLRLRQEALAASYAWARRAALHELGRRDPDAWRELGFAQLGLDQTANALDSLEQARERDPFLRQPVDAMRASANERRVARAAEMYFAIARCREALGNRETAAEAYGIASRLAPDDIEYLRMAGLSLCRVLRYAEGLEKLEEARRRTTDAKARAELDVVIADAHRSAREVSARLVRDGETAQAAGDMRKAVTLYEQAVEVNPESVRAWIRAGWLRGMWFGNYATAEKYLGAAESLLRKGKVPQDSLDWRQLRDFRQELAKQKAEEDADLKRGDGDR